MASITHDFREWGTGELAGSTTAAQFPSQACKTVLLKAQVDNAGNVYIGTSSSVTKAAGTTDTTSGYQLDAGNELRLFVGNLNELYYICDNGGDDISYVWQG
jgi:hypothetical protein